MIPSIGRREWSSLYARRHEKPPVIEGVCREAIAPGIWRTAEVLGFDHSHFGPYDLLLRALIAALGGRSHAAVQRLRAANCIFGNDVQTQAA